MIITNNNSDNNNNNKLNKIIDYKKAYLDKIKEYKSSKYYKNLNGKINIKV